MASAASDAASRKELRATSLSHILHKSSGPGSAAADGGEKTRLKPRNVETPPGPGGPPNLSASGRPPAGSASASSSSHVSATESSSSDRSTSKSQGDSRAAVAGGQSAGAATDASAGSTEAKGRKATESIDSRAGTGLSDAASGAGGPSEATASGTGGSTASAVTGAGAGTGEGAGAAAGGASTAARLRIPLGGTSKAVASTVEALPSSCSSVRMVSGAEAMNAAYRSTMEDAFVVIDKFGGDDGTGLFAVYDGHGGRFVAEYLRTHLHDNVERELLAKSDRSVEECLKSAFVLTDIECSRTGEAASGATAILCIVRQQGPKRYVYTANCGDARAVLCHDGRAVRLSMDHKATDEPEVRRIESAGGFVVKRRVMGCLAVARAFGDFSMKKYVTPEPFTSTTKLNASSYFLIIACDGVWDVLEDQEAVDLVRLHVQPGGEGGKEPAGAPPRAAAMKGAADLIVKESLKRGSSDNVTCLVVFL